MSKQFFILLIGILSYTVSYAGDDALMFKAKMVLKNGHSFTGYYFTFSSNVYDIKDKKGKAINIKSDKGFQQFLNQQNIHGGCHSKTKEKIKGLVFYKTVYATKSDDTNVFPIGFCAESDVVILHPDSIKYTVFLGQPNLNFSYYGVGVRVLDSASINDLRNNKVLSTYSLASEGACYVGFICTNKDFTTDKIAAYIKKRKWTFDDIVQCEQPNSAIEAELAALGIYLYIECSC